MENLIKSLPRYSMLMLAMLFSISLVLFRVAISGNLHFVFLLWNLFLAFVPFIIAEFISVHRLKSWIWILLPLWLLFFPNAPYIITDLFHLQPREDMAFWFDTLLLFSFALNGLILAFLSLQSIEHFLIAKTSLNKTRFIIICILMISAFGIYAGRYLRWNSWDVFMQPSVLFYDMNDRIIHPLDHLKTYGITLFYGIFLSLAYYSIKWMPKTMMTAKAI